MTAEIPGFGGRREAREEALAVLYEVELTAETVLDALGARDVGPAAYAIELAEGVDDEVDDLDAIIGRHLTGWRIERMALIDKVLARIATFELLRCEDVPTGVVLSEAVELATQYSGEQSPRFLNGVLRSVANELRPSK